MKKIAIVLGTARENNYSQKVAEIVKNTLEEKNLEVDFIDVSDFLFGKTVGPENESVKSWKETVEKVDGLIFVSPEYNHSYPGELKILIDSLYDEYKGKIAGLVTVSAGNYGGVRVAEKLNDLLHTVNFKLLHKAVNVANVQDSIDEEKIKKHLEGLLEEINIF